MRLDVLTDADALADRAAAELARSARGTDRFTLALSGGSTPRRMLERFAARTDVDWGAVHVFQVDERVAPDGDPARNLTMLHEALLDRVPVGGMHPIPVEGDPADYEAQLPASFDLIQLGLGDDGHVASLVPGDPALDVDDRQVALTGEYRGHRRVTLTFPALARAQRIVWVVSGAGKAEPLARLLAGDTTIPAGRVPTDRALVLVDRAAMGG